MESLTLLSRRGLKYVAIILLTSISCLDFRFESEYEDINGIYLEFLKHYQHGGQKLLFRGDTGYISRYDSLLIYDFARVDSIYLMDIYMPGYQIADFLLEGDYAFLILPVGLRIVDIRNSQPHIVGTLALQYPEIIEKFGDYVYIAAANNLIITDVTEKANPILITSYAFDNSINHLEVDSNFAYILSGSDIKILSIEEPNAPSLTYSLSFTDTLPQLQTFSKKGSHLYVSAKYSDSVSSVLIAYDLSANHTLRRVSQMTSPFRIRYIDSGGPYMLALSLSFLSLINLEYPSSPCVGEMTTPGGMYGIIHGEHIYTLDYRFLAIFEIRQAE